MEILKQLEALIQTKISVYKTLFSLFRLEAQLASLSIFPLLLTILMLLIVLFTVWLSITILIGYVLILIFNRPILSISLVVLLNIGVFLTLIRYLSYNLKNMSFQKTRKHFFNNKSTPNKLEKRSK